MSKREKDDPSVYVRVEDCRERYGRISLALFGPDGREGIVKDIGDIKSDMRLIKENLKGRLSGKDKVAIISAVLLAVASIVVALLK